MTGTDSAEATRNFNMVWCNDYDSYQTVLRLARECLRQVPTMTDQALGRNVKDFVFALRNGGGWGWPDGTGGPRFREVLQWIDADSHPLVNEEAVAEEVRELLGIEAS